MNISIIKASFDYLDICADILKGSELGMKYFINEDNQYIGKELLKEGFENNEIYVGLEENNNCVGFAWIQPNGMFHWFPFLHAVVVKEDFRGSGIGTQFMDFFHHFSFEKEKSHIAFLMVGSFNDKAISLYKKLGYKIVGEVPNLFIDGISEYLMSRTKEK